MNIYDTLYGNSQINQVQKPLKSGAIPGKIKEPVFDEHERKFPTTKNATIRKPIQILSNEELSLLQQLFPEQEQGIVKDSTYSLGRKKIAAVKLGSFIDIKR